MFAFKFDCLFQSCIDQQSKVRQRVRLCMIEVLSNPQRICRLSAQPNPSAEITNIALKLFDGFEKLRKLDWSLCNSILLTVPHFFYLAPGFQTRGDSVGCS